MSTMNRKVPIISGTCRCCGETKRCRILNVPYQWQEQMEVYSEMFVDCFGLLLSHLEGDAAERAICLSCVAELRKAAAFRRRVLSCEEQLLKARIYVHSEDAISDAINVKEEKREIKLEDLNLIDPSQEPPSLKTHLSEGYCNTDCNYTSHTKKSKKEKEMKGEIDDIDDCPTKQPPDKASDDVNMGEDSTASDDNDNISLASLLAAREKEMKLKYAKKLPKLMTSKTKIFSRSVAGWVVRRKETMPAQTDIQLKPRRKYLETIEKAYSNTVTIVENSYVCPFTTSFSDYYCTYCRHTFTDPSKLREHTLQHDPTTFKAFYDNKKIAQVDIMRIDCRLCSAEINNIEELKDHLQKAHEKFIFPVNNEFLKFKLTISNLTCIECNLGNFQFFHALKKHMADHFGAYICSMCGAHFFNKKTLLIHQKIHRSTKQLYPCQHCGKTFISRHERNIHEKRIHKKEAAFRCARCDEVFFSYALRYRHLIIVHGEERTFPCNCCDKVYDSRKSLREHNRRTHLKIMKHQCDLCDRKFYQPSRLKEHMSTHTGERNYRCEFCGKSYPRLRGLKVHVQSHVAEKKYKCKLCKVSYSQNISLKNHIKQHHPSATL